MKKKKMLVILTSILAVCVLAAVLIGSRPWYRQPERIFEKNREALDSVVETYLSDGMVSYPVMDGIISVNQWGEENQILEFMTKGFGITPASTYRGFYYSVNGGPAAFQGMDCKLTYQEKDGWYEWTGEGDNGGRTKQIDGNWYVFEAHF